MLEALLCGTGLANEGDRTDPRTASSSSSSSSSAALKRSAASSSQLRKSASASSGGGGGGSGGSRSSATDDHSGNFSSGFRPVSDGSSIDRGRGIFYEENPDKPRKGGQFRFGGMGCSCSCAGGACGHGEAERPKAFILRSIFDDHCMYDLASGREMAVYSRSRYSLDSGSTIVTGLTLAEPKNSPAPAATVRSSGDAALSLPRTTLRNVSWDLALLGGQQAEDELFAVDYDVVVPWVLRNMAKSASDRATGGGFSSGIELLRDMLRSLDRGGGESGDTLVVPELRAVLGELGVRVTTDILREMARRYPADMDDIRSKWAWIEGKRREEDRKMALALGEDKDAGAGRGEGKSEGKGEKGRRDDEDDDFRRRYGYSTTDRRSDDKSEDKAEDKGTGKGKDSKSTLMSLRTSLKRPDAVGGYFSTLTMDKADENLGLDTQALLDDISSGRGLRTLTRAPEYMTLSGQPLDDELQELLADRGGAGGASREMSHYDGSSSSLSSCGRTANRNTAPVELPASVTITMIMKARKSVVNVCDNFGRTPLLLSAGLGSRDLLACLLLHGGDVSVVTAEGHNAFTVAKSPSIRMLLEKPLLTWMNHRQHTRGRGVSSNGPENDEVLAAMDKLHSEVTAIDRSMVGSSSSSNGLFRSRSLGLGLGLSLGMGMGGSGADEQLLFSTTMHTDQRAEVVASLTTQLRGLQDAQWAYGRPPLLWAVHNGLPAAVRDMLSAAAGTDPNVMDAVGRRALHECAALTHSRQPVHLEAAVPIAEMLVTAGANVNAMSVSGRTALHEVFCMNRDDAVSCYRLSYKGVSAICQNSAPLAPPALAASSRRQLVRALLRLGGDPLLADRQGLAAVHYCAREDLSDCMMEVIRAGHDVSATTPQQQTPLHVACKAGSTRVAQLLCRWDADSPVGQGIGSHKDVQGKLPRQLLPRTASSVCCETLWGLCRSGLVSRVAEMLSKVHASGPAWEDVEGTTVDLHNLAVSLDVTFNLGDGPPANDESKEDEKDEGKEESKVESSGARSSIRVPRLKPSSGGQELWLVDGIDAKTRRLRWSPLHACVVGWAEHRVLLHLKDKGGKGWNQREMPLAKFQKERQREGGLVSASAVRALGLGSQQAVGYFGGAAQHRETLALLVKRHAFLDSLDANCRTPLMVAAACNLSDAVTVLLDNGADFRVTDLERNTALHIAYAFGSLSSALLLEARGADTEAVNGRNRIPTEEAGCQSSLIPLLHRIE